MNNFLELVEALKVEIDTMTRQYGAIQALDKENKIEQDKILEQNQTIKHTIDSLDTDRKNIEEEKSKLDAREKQILIREKQNVIFDQKLQELQDRTAELILKEKKFKLEQEAFLKEKSIIDKKTEVYKKLEETDAMGKARMKLKEEEIDKELVRLKNMNI